MNDVDRTVEETRRYPALMTIAGVANILAVIVIVLGIAASVVGMIDGFGDTFLHGLWIGLLGLATTVLYAVFLFAVGEGIRVIVDIEENTRTSGRI